MSASVALALAKKYRSGGAVEANPSLAQKEAGNYKMRHISFQGIPISIENPKGTVRSGIDSDGKPWANRMTADYGYIKRTNGKDGDQVDCFVGPNRRSDKVWVIDQLHHQHHKFDEHKCLLGFDTEKQAMTAYHASYGRKYGAHHTVGGVTEMSVDAFKEWLKGGGGKKPVSPDVPKYQTGGAVDGKKIRRDAFLYMNPKPPENTFAQCGTCAMFTGTGCTILGKTKITKDMTCALYVHGKPSYDLKGKEMALVTPQEAGLYDGQVRCENCRYGGTHCKLYRMLNDRMPEAFDLETKIDPKGCCNAFTKGAATYQEGGAVSMNLFDPTPMNPPKTPRQRVMEGHQEFEQGYLHGWDIPDGPNYPMTIMNMRGQQLYARRAQEGGGVKYTEPTPEDPTRYPYYESEPGPGDAPAQPTTPAPQLMEAPGVGSVPTFIPETAKAIGKAAAEYVETPGELMKGPEQVQPRIEGQWDEIDEERQRRANAEWSKRATDFAAETGLNLFGTSAPFVKPGTLGVAGGRPPGGAGQAVVHELAQNIAEKIVERHGGNVESIEGALNNLRQTTNDRVATAVYAKLPEDVQFELAMREMHLQQAEAALPQQTQAPVFREITHPEEARDWLRDNATGHQVNWSERDPQYFVELANKMKKEQMGLARPAEAAPEARIPVKTAPRQGALEPETPTGPINLDDFFGMASPSQVPHLSVDEILSINDSLTKHPNPYSFQSENPELWDAFHQRLDEINSRSGRVSGPTVVPFTTPQGSVPGPWGHMSQDFQQLFKRHIQPHTDWFPSGRNDERSFFEKFFAGADTSQVSATVTPDPHDWSRAGLAFDGPIFIGGKNASPALQVEIFPESKYAHHSYFKLSPEFRSTDLGHTLMKNWIDLYEQMGLNRVDLYAALQSGPYVWNKYGFVPYDHYWRDIKASLQDLIQRDHFKITNPQTRADVMSILQSDNPKAAWLLADFNKLDDYGNHIGKAAFLGAELKNKRGSVGWSPHNWEGSLNLKDRQSMERFDAWIRKQIEKKSTTQQ